MFIVYGGEVPPPSVGGGGTVPPSLLSHLTTIFEASDLTTINAALSVSEIGSGTPCKILSSLLSVLESTLSIDCNLFRVCLPVLVLAASASVVVPSNMPAVKTTAILMAKSDFLIILYKLFK